jgi:hypothetical protein
VGLKGLADRLRLRREKRRLEAVTGNQLFVGEYKFQVPSCNELIIFMLKYWV